MRAPQCYRRNYDLFNLHPNEKTILRNIIKKRRNLINPQDPYFAKCTQGPFNQKVQGVYKTDSILEVLDASYDSLKKRGSTGTI